MRAYLATLLFLYSTSLCTAAIAEPVFIQHQLPYVDIKVGNKIIRIERNPDNENMIDLDYALTSRPCPPYCIQPITLDDGVETLGELEVLNYLKKLSAGDNSILLIDSREDEWLSKGMIPGAIHIPWNKLYNRTASQTEIIEILTFKFGVILQDKIFNFQDAKILIFYCNGAWCGQSPTNIRALLALGYPANKLKWYRGGMQSWKSFGLTTIQPPLQK